MNFVEKESITWNVLVQFKYYLLIFPIFSLQLFERYREVRRAAGSFWEGFGKSDTMILIVGSPSGFLTPCF
jgi:hypothetical protein